MRGQTIAVLLLLSVIGASKAMDFEKLMKDAKTIGNALGLQNSGKLPLGNGCVINWSYEGMMVGFEFKYMGVCTHSCSNEAETVFTEGKGGAVEHCLTNLLRKVARSDL